MALHYHHNTKNDPIGQQQSYQLQLRMRRWVIPAKNHPISLSSTPPTKLQTINSNSDNGSSSNNKINVSATITTAGSKMNSNITNKYYLFYRVAALQLNLHSGRSKPF